MQQNSKVENSERNNPEQSFIRTQNKTGRPLEAPQRKQKLRGPQEPQKKFTEHKSTTIIIIIIIIIMSL